MPRTLRDEHLLRLPIFPLPGLVFFPGTLLPLHIFEPRYRALTAWCLDHGWPMAVVRVEPDADEVRPGVPAVAEVMGVGRIERHERLPDGRYNLVLRGLARVRAVEELPQDEPFRRVRAERLATRCTLPEVELAEATRSLGALVQGVVQRWPDAGPLFAPALRQEAGPEGLVDALGSLVLTDTDARQRLLAEPDLGARVREVSDRLVGLLAVTPFAGSVPEA